MSVSYDLFINAFLSKVTEYNFLALDDESRTEVVDNFLFKALSNSTFKKVCPYDFSKTKNNHNRSFEVNIPEDEIDEIINIVSEGMLIQWMKPFVYRQELFENLLNTKDFTTYSPAELLLRVGNAYNKAQQDYIQMMREYSFNHGDLTVLHL